ncbi:hypothetical protein V7O66_02435 [Methanolobus sp. ZRKC3]|uniref:hypothetical protein n=1 Tax=Methanolobus sp. ZRKC3 TaxID=3125786 RepID=UPI003253E447
MKKTIMLLTIGALVLLVSGIGAVNAQTNEDNNAWYGPMYNWMANNMGGYGYGPGACWGNYGSNYAGTTQEVTVGSVDDAYDIAKTEISADVSIDNIYQMGRWWVVYYTDDDGAIKQGRIDSFTGEVITDFNTLSDNYQYRNSGRNYRDGMGYGMMYGN